MKKLVLWTVALAVLLGGGAVAYQKITGKKIFCCPFEKTAQAADVSFQDGCENCPAQQRRAKADASAAVAELFRAQKIDVNFENSAVLDVLKHLGEKGLNYAYRTPDEFKDLTVTAKMKDVTVLGAAEAVFRALNIDYFVTDEGVLVVDAD